MTALAGMSPATRWAEEIYSRFIELVIEEHVFQYRIGVKPERIRKKVAEGKYTDTRFVQLMTVSGKGGYSPDKATFARQARYTNVSLLDHLLSVGRGAMLFYGLDCMHQNPEMQPQLLKPRLALLLALGFMHDADKIAGMSRTQNLTADQVLKIADDYGIDDFCKAFDLQLSPAHWLGMIASVEGTQAHRYFESQPPPRGMDILPLYVAFADKLDGAWLLDDPEDGGIAGVFQRLKKDHSIENNLLHQWKPLVLHDPHHPFLLDDLQRWISLESRRATGLPPLIETHHDGELCMLLPAAEFDAIVQKGLDRLCGKLPFGLRLDVSNRGVPSLYNAQPKFEELGVFVRESLTEEKISSLFKVKYDVAQTIWDDLVELLDEADVAPSLPQKNLGLVTLFSSLDSLGEIEKAWVRKVALLVLLTNLQVKSPAKAKIPGYDQREKQLLKAMGQVPLPWIASITDAPSRRVVVSMWIGVLAEEDEGIDQSIFGPDGLLKQWLEGGENAQGFRHFITGGGERILGSVRNRFESLLSQSLADGDKPGARGRCLFTGEPVAFGPSIAQADDLYGVKVSAFSGRDNRPESITIQKAHTNVSATSLAEHKIRSAVHKNLGGKKAGVPSIVSSPATFGLFGGLATTDDKAMPAMSIFDLSRQDRKKGRTLKGSEIYSGRHRIARFERMPEKTVEQIDILRMLLTAALRTGRPLHVFRGLPVKQKAFFHYDAMPRIFEELLGGKSLRIEQLPEAIERLETARSLGETRGLGYDILTLYAQRATRFRAICLACGVLEEEGKDGNVIHILKSQFEEFVKGEIPMKEQDGALVQLGRCAAGIQMRPASNSGREERLVFNLCMDAAVQSRASGQVDRQSLVYAIAGELENNLVRKGKAAAKKRRQEVPLMDACIAAAELFVDKVWFDALKGRVPSHKTRRLFAEIYRMSFLQTHRENVKNNTEESR